MKLLFSFFIAFVLILQIPDLETIRTYYSNATVSKTNSEKFARLVEKNSTSEPVFSGYRAVSKIISAKFMKGDDRKTAISNGIKSLENVVNSNSNNIELRLIRLSVQENLPKIIKYNSKIKEDKTFILRNYSKQNGSLKNYIKEFAKISKSISIAEKASLK